MTDLFSFKDAAALVSLAEARLRYWAQTGFVGPTVRRQGRSFYTFQDLIAVKAAKELLDSGVPMQRVRKNLEALRAALPHIDRPLAQLRVCSDGNEVVVVAEDVAFAPASGQLVMSFAVGALESRIAEVLPFRPPAEGSRVPAPASHARGAAAAPDAPARSAYAAFLAGVEAEDAGDLARAESHYRRAIELDRHLAAAWTNLGNACEHRGARGEAREAYETALALDPDLPEARYNLANLLADVGEGELAVAEYRRVAAACPEFADAHFNLGLLLLQHGEDAEARAHLERYLALDDSSEWAARAREALGALS